MNIQFLPQLQLPRLAATALMFTTAFTAHAVTIFTDDFDYTGWDTGADPMNVVWAGSKAPKFNPTAVPSGGSYPDSYIGLTNGYVYADLGQTLTEDFSITVTMLPQNYGFFNWFAITNADGSEGYYVFWDAALSTQYDGQGKMYIGKITSEITSYTAPGTAISATNLVSGYTVDELPFAEFTLSWDSSTSTITLTGDGGSVITTITDSSFSDFSRIYLSGNGGQSGGLYGSVSVASSIPEASTVAYIVPTLLIMFIGRRRLKRETV